MNPATEFDEWAKQFEPGYREEWDSNGRSHTVNVPAKCMYPVTEGPHKVAHRITAHHRSIDGYPVCQHHAHKPVRPAWRGYVEGA